MTDDATLSDFASSSTSDETDDRAESETVGSEPDGHEAAPAGSDGSDESNPQSEPKGETVPSLYAWGEYTCTRCETTTERAWRDDRRIVCPDCKTW